MSNNNSYRFVLKGSEQAAEKILELYHSGELNKLLGVTVTKVVVRDIAPSPISLRDWLIHSMQKVVYNINSNWLPSQELLKFQPIPTLGELDDFIYLLQPNQPEIVRRQAAEILGELAAKQPNSISEVSQALIHLLETTQDEETRWQAVISLGKIMPEHIKAGIQKARQIDLGIKLKEYKLALIMTVMPKSSERIGIWVQVKSMEQSMLLPAGLKLSILSESGESQTEVIARSDEQNQNKDALIQTRFSPPPNTYFQVKVTLDDNSFTESFIA